MEDGIEVFLRKADADGPVRQHVVRQYAASVAAERTEIAGYGFQVLPSPPVSPGVPRIGAVTMKLAVLTMRAASRPVAGHGGLTQLHAGSKTSGNGTGKPKACPRPVRGRTGRSNMALNKGGGTEEEKNSEQEVIATFNRAPLLMQHGKACHPNAPVTTILPGA